SCRCKDPEPGLDLEIRVARFFNGRDFRSAFFARWPSYCQALKRASPDLADPSRHVVKHDDGSCTADQIHQRGTCSFIGHMFHLQSGSQVEQFTSQMDGGAYT